MNSNEENIRNKAELNDSELDAVSGGAYQPQKNNDSTATGKREIDAFRVAPKPDPNKR